MLQDTLVHREEERGREGGREGGRDCGREGEIQREREVHGRVEQVVSAGLVSFCRWPVPSLAQVLAAAVVRWPFQEPVSPRLAKGQSPGGRLPCSCSTAHHSSPPLTPHGARRPLNSASTTRCPTEGRGGGNYEVGL